jgi:excisionase family DNA binding protein
MKNHLTVTETAERLKLTRQAVLYAIKAEKLPAERAGRQWLIRAQDIEAAYFVNIWDGRGKLLNHFHGAGAPEPTATAKRGKEQAENGTHETTA